VTEEHLFPATSQNLNAPLTLRRTFLSHLFFRFDLPPVTFLRKQSCRLGTVLSSAGGLFILKRTEQPALFQIIGAPGLHRCVSCRFSGPFLRTLLVWILRYFFEPQTDLYVFFLVCPLDAGGLVLTAPVQRESRSSSSFLYFFPRHVPHLAARMSSLSDFPSRGWSSPPWGLPVDGLRRRVDFFFPPFFRRTWGTRCDILDARPPDITLWLHVCTSFRRPVLGSVSVHRFLVRFSKVHFWSGRSPFGRSSSFAGEWPRAWSD